MENKKLVKKLVTHDGSFHADDIFSAAALILYLEKTTSNFSAQGGPASGWEIIRTRDEETINNADYIFDVGGIYDSKLNKFDHHQIGGAGKHSSGIEYASFGLVWKKFGIELCGSQKATEIIEKKLVAPIDAHDNGFDLVENKFEISPYSIQDFFYSMRPTWREEHLADDEMFLKCVGMAKEVLSREIIQAKDGVLAEEAVILAYKNTEDKRIIILDKHYPFEYILQNFPEPLFVICPSRAIKNKWTVRALREDSRIFKNRKNFPKSWAGLLDEELQNVSGVSDAVFCHRGLFMVVAKSKNGAITLAQKALEATS